MKRISILSTLIVCGLLIGCDQQAPTAVGPDGPEQVLFAPGGNGNGPTAHHGDRYMREIPFKAKLSTKRVPEKLGDVECSNPALPAPNYQEGGGTGTHLGKFTIVLTFCSGAGGVYGDIKGYMEAANGDRIFIKHIPGPVGQVMVQIPWDPNTVYDAYFMDPFYIEGGTGRFEGVTGEGMFDSKVDLWNDDYPFPGPIIPDHQTDHVMTGTLTLPNGK